MNETTRNRRDFLQNIAITLLSLSAVVLFVQSQLHLLGSASSFFDLFAPPAPQSEYTAASSLSVPVQAAVTGAYGRYGTVTATTADEEFQPLAHLLGNALRSAETFTQTAEQAFLDAVRTPSVFYDFRTALPLPLLASMTDAVSSASVSARQLVIVAAEDGVDLLLQDGEGTYLRSRTDLAAQTLEETLNYYELGNARFAMDLSASAPAAETLSPCSLLPDTIPVLPTLNSSVPYTSEDTQLLSAFQFNPNTKFRYTDSSGTEFIEENGRTLHLHPNGTVYYQDSTDSASLRIKSAAARPTLTEAAEGTASLLRTLLADSVGEASLYLQTVEETENSFVLTFGYQAHGVPIRFSDGGNAAVVTLTGSSVSKITLRLQRYTSTGSSSLILPVQQVLAIAESNSRADLSISYADSGTGVISAGWLLDQITD